MARTDTFDFGRVIGELANPVGDVGRVAEWRQCEAIADTRTRRAYEAGISIPLDAVMSRDLVVGTASAGGNLAGSPVVAHGASLLGASVTDLVTHVPVPRGTPSVPIINTAPAGAWIDGEGGAIPANAEGTFDTVALTPTSVGVMLRYSIQLQRGGGREFNALIRGEINRAIERKVGAAILAGSGASGEPLGLTGTTGVLTASGTALSDATILDAIRRVLATGAQFGDLRFVIGSQTYETLAGRERAAGSGFVISDGMTIRGIPVIVSELAAADSLFLGPWRECVYATWGGVDLLVDRRSVAYGAIRLSAFLDLAIGFRRPGSFAHIDSIT